MTRSLPCALLALTFSLSAQDAPAPRGSFDPDEARALVRTACATMARLTGGEFASLEIQDDAMTRRFRGQLPAGANEVEVDGKWCGEVREASLNLGADTVVLYRGRMLAKGDDGWRPRAGVLAEGTRLPFVADPPLLFELLATLPATCRINLVEPTTYREQEMTIYSMTLEGEDAVDLALAGAFPNVASGGMVLMGFGGHGGERPVPETTIDLALYVTADALVHRVRARVYQENAMAGNVQIQIAGGGDAGPDANEDVEEFDDNGKRIYRKGLPVRALGRDLSMMEFDVRFKAHGSKFEPALDEAAAAFLRLR